MPALILGALVNPASVVADNHHGTIENVVASYGYLAEVRMKPYFMRAEVSYPPKEIVLLATKEEKALELWARNEGDFTFIRRYPISKASGGPGPKLREGDKQVPEGIYRITHLNPNSRFHLSMRLDYPNSYDLMRAAKEGRTNPGGDIYIHGKAQSTGCLAVGDIAVEELFVLVNTVGTEQASVVIAPHDPRRQPLDGFASNLPRWAVELYADISREFAKYPKGDI
ncbi:L,D-transpeptidase family protein [uncultured Oceanisphaera sp.]|uniref:L,D-transpeptidase family protein n=1 Tax=uncultured Oceanisphaera sp. TaxID=353858 RepID=UPI0026174539|nr:L,D-transpeptidase family protein [uncultured Oceanisphaera sp.]